MRVELARLREERDRHITAAEKATIEREQALSAVRAAEQAAAYARDESKVWEQLAQEVEQAQKQLSEQLAALQKGAQGQAKETLALFARNAESASAAINLDEAATRELIDQQLRDAGWEADSQTLRFSVGARPERGRKLAIAEWPTESGPADYVLFDGFTALAVVEAKRKSVDVSAALDQAKRYSRSFLTKDVCELPGGPWREYRIPYVFSTNGRPFLQQLRTQSGIWVCDVRRPQNLSAPIDGWYSPEGLREQLKQDVDAAERKLEEVGFAFGFPLRHYQRDAILATEQAIKEGRRTALLAMATGTGKTKTCIALVYRLLKAKRFRRILFLVDRNALGEQAANAFKDTRMESVQTFVEVFGIKELEEAAAESDTKVHIATVQGMVRRLLFAADDATRPTVDQYDCIVVDECHRGYLLDRELSETEITFRDQEDYISKYRRVLDYFDAVKIGLTATPALHTTEIFGAPVYTYTYREAVLDGYLVDHETPVIIETKLSQSGIKWKKGEAVTLLNVKKQVLESAKAPDEIKLEVTEFNKKVITEPFNQVVCDQLAQHIDPNLPGKTLIFCATDRHADMVVDLLKQAYQKTYGEIEDDAIQKITGASDKPIQLIRRYKNERLPNIAVTVDLLTTGIDVPQIVNLVFIRRVNSRILYEQMLGRGTRLCEEIGKESFRIFDAVALYENMAQVTTMKPVVASPNITYQQLIDELVRQTDPAIREQAREEMLAKFIRKHKKMTEEGLKAFEAKAGMSPKEFVEQLKTRGINELAKWFSDRQDLGELLDRKGTFGESFLFVSTHEDKLVAVHRGYGLGQKPDDYLQSFTQFIRDNRNAIPALLAVLTRPRELTRQELKALSLELEKHGFNEKNLDAAWQETTNQAIAARIIGYIRQAALGDPLVPYEERVERAVRQVQARHQLTPVQAQWLGKIANQMKVNLVVDRQALDEDYFKDEAGGFARLNKLFNGELTDILAELNETALGQVAEAIK
ncbi:MAG: type I restriction-modification system endonuclease [Sulfuricaulis sp.]